MWVDATTFKDAEPNAPGAIQLPAHVVGCEWRSWRAVQRGAVGQISRRAVQGTNVHLLPTINNFRPPVLVPSPAPAVKRGIGRDAPAAARRSRELQRERVAPAADDSKLLEAAVQKMQQSVGQLRSKAVDRNRTAGDPKRAPELRKSAKANTVRRWQGPIDGGQPQPGDGKGLQYAELYQQFQVGLGSAARCWALGGASVGGGFWRRLYHFTPRHPSAPLACLPSTERRHHVAAPRRGGHAEGLHGGSHGSVGVRHKLPAGSFARCGMAAGAAPTQSPLH